MIMPDYQATTTLKMMKCQVKGYGKWIQILTMSKILLKVLRISPSTLKQSRMINKITQEAQTKTLIFKIKLIETNSTNTKT